MCECEQARVETETSLQPMANKREQLIPGGSQVPLGPGAAWVASEGRLVFRSGAETLGNRTVSVERKQRLKLVEAVKDHKRNGSKCFCQVQSESEQAQGEHIS